ncbi:hypothetical protein FHG87_000736 [Trinorchestia longiramus]|nr:hypothetical protein FHG87_000736 [Trinorchestia longiramus]
MFVPSTVKAGSIAMGFRTQRVSPAGVLLLLCLVVLGVVEEVLAHPPPQPLAAVTHQYMHSTCTQGMRTLKHMYALWCIQASSEVMNREGGGGGGGGGGGLTTAPFSQHPSSSQTTIFDKKTDFDGNIMDEMTGEKFLQDQRPARRIRSAATGEYDWPNSAAKATNPRILPRSRYSHILKPSLINTQSVSSPNEIGYNENAADILLGTGMMVMGSTERDLKNGQQNSACPKKCQKWDPISKDPLTSALAATPNEDEHKFQHAQNSTLIQTDAATPTTKVPDQKSDILIIYTDDMKNASPLSTLASGNQRKPNASDRPDSGGELGVDKTTQTTRDEQAAHNDQRKVINEERLLEHGPFEEETIEDPPIVDEFDANEDFEADAQLEEDGSEFDAQSDLAEDELEYEQKGITENYQQEESDHFVDYDYATDLDNRNHSDAGNADYDTAFEQEVERLYDESEAQADLETDIQEDMAHEPAQQENSKTTVSPITEYDEVQPTTSRTHIARENGNLKMNEAKRAQLIKLAKERKKMRTYPKNINEKIHAIRNENIAPKKPEKTNLVSKSGRHEQPRRIVSGQNLENANLNNTHRKQTPPSSNNSQSPKLPLNSVNKVPNQNSNVTLTPRVQNSNSKSGALTPLGHAQRLRNNGLRRTNAGILVTLPGQRQPQDGHSLEHPTVMMSLLSGSYLKCPVCSKQDPRGYCRPVFWCGMWPLAHKTKP